MAPDCKGPLIAHRHLLQIKIRFYSIKYLHLLHVVLMLAQNTPQSNFHKYSLYSPLHIWIELFCIIINYMLLWKSLRRLFWFVLLSFLLIHKFPMRILAITKFMLISHMHKLLFRIFPITNFNEQTVKNRPLITTHYWSYPVIYNNTSLKLSINWQ